MHTTTLTLLALAASARSHTWIEQLNVISSDGTFVGDAGFVRGNVNRTDPAFSDATMTNLIPPNGRSTGNEILSTDPICMSSQQQQVQRDGPRLQAQPGSAVALRYQENGHVTLPNNQPGKPANRGTAFAYGTTQPSPNDTFLAIHRVWNAEGTGGDKRGVLLSSQNFDDGQCYQVNGGNISIARQAEFPHTAGSLMGINIWCQHDIALPTDAPSGQPYTIYWVWDWPTAAGAPGEPDGKLELYTTCMDIDILSNGTANAVESSNFNSEASLNDLAVSAEFADITNPTAVAAPSEPPVASGIFSAGSSPTDASSAIAGSPTSDVATSPQATPSTFATVTQSNAGSTISPIPAAVTTSAGVDSGTGPLTATVTEYDRVTETVFQTIYPTSGFKIRGKRH